VISTKLREIFYGGDYNAEQWPEEVWREDMRLMKQAGVNLVTVGVFSWAHLEPSEGDYHFDWLDRLLDLLAENSIFTDLATATAAQPAWMSLKYPDVLPVDERGSRISYGSRQTYCPNSPSYRRLASEMTRRLAERYGGHPALLLWHVNNEYGCHTPACYCDTCAVAFRVWLKQRYSSLVKLNEAWGTAFWSQQLGQWDEILPPRATSTFKNPGQVLDYRRFMSHSLLACFQAEAEILWRNTPDIPVTTNFPPDHKPLDGFAWARAMDVVSWDSYPDPVPGADPAHAAFGHDLMRGLKGGRPFLLLEQAPSQVNWRAVNTVKRPGIMRLWSYQALARGADGVMFFQWRQSRRGAEKFHSGMVDHSGNEQGRVYREISRLGAELKKLSSIPGSKVPAKAAMLFDYELWWALEQSPPSDRLNYLDLLRDYYRCLYRLNVAVDFVSFSADLTAYDLILAPALYMVKPGLAENIERSLAGGSRFLTTFFSGIVDETDAFFAEGFPGPLKDFLGLRVEEYDPLPPGLGNRMITAKAEPGLKPEYACSLWCDVVRPEGARVLASFGADYHAGDPCVTEHLFPGGGGPGRAYYIATRPEPAFILDFLSQICRELDLLPLLKVPAGVEAVTRTNGSRDWLFLLNHGRGQAVIDLGKQSFQELISGRQCRGTLPLPANGVAVLESRPG
jgi:beta-galactosidase